MNRLKRIWVFTLSVVLLSCGAPHKPSLCEQGQSCVPNQAAPIKGLRGELIIGVIGDINGGLGNIELPNSSQKNLKALLATNPALVLGTGDYVAGGDYRQNFPASLFAKLWARFEERVLKPINAQGVVFAPTPGNHDAGVKRERAAYKHFWQQHRPKVQMVSGEMYPFYYSFLYQDVFFISLDDVTVRKIKNNPYQGVSQRVWLMDQLKSKTSQGAIARIVYGHVPLYPVLSKKKYTSGTKGKYFEVLSDEQLGKKENSLEEIFKRERVSLAIFGHSHAYYPGVVQHRGEALEDSLSILSMPCAGNGNRYIQGRPHTRSQRGFAVLKIDRTTGHIRYDAYTQDGKVIDKDTLPIEIKPSTNVTIKRKDIVDGILRP